MGSMHITAVHVGTGAFDAWEHADGTGRSTLTLVGELDQIGDDVLEAVLARTWSRWPSGLTIDLRQVGILDTCGLGSLLRASRTARSRRVRLTLVCRPGRLARLLRLGGLGDQLREIPRAVRGTNHTAAPSLLAAGRGRRPCPRRSAHRL